MGGQWELWCPLSKMVDKSTILPIKLPYQYRFRTEMVTDMQVVDSDEEIVVSTTRPETMLGDVAVSVHPR